MELRYCGLTHPGKVRQNNEDALLIQEREGLVILADGMGGYKAGEVASSMAVNTIGKELGNWLSSAAPESTEKNIRRAMEISVDKANAAIFQASQHNPQYTGMGTTLVLAVLRANTLIVGHIGDSRCYRYRHRQLTQLTKDHSLLQERIDAGLLTRKQATVALNKNVVTRALGVDDAVVLDINDYAVASGDIYLLCSDGLSDMLDDRLIGKILDNEETIEDKASALINTANAYGGQDNISVILIETGVITKRRSLFARLLGQ